MSGEFAGTLDQHVVLRRRPDTRDDLGTASGAFTDIATFWARIEPARLGPWGQGDRPVPRPRWRATVRQALDIRLDDRLRWRGLPLGIRSIEAPAPDRLVLLLELLP